MPIKKTSYLTLLSHDVRRRHEHARNGSIILSFCVQVEVSLAGKWHPVVRYDTAHGFAHRDLLMPNGKVEKTPLFLHTFNEALDFSEADLRSNWESYVERYHKETQK